MAVGIVLTIIGFGIGPTTTGTEQVCDYDPSWGMNTCETQQVEKPSIMGILTLYGGALLFGGGWGGWVGTVDSDKRLREKIAELEAASSEVDE